MFNCTPASRFYNLMTSSSQGPCETGVPLMASEENVPTSRIASVCQLFNTGTSIGTWLYLG